MPLSARPERIVGGRYRLCEALGRGGTSTVWRAYDQVLDRDVAVKILGDGDDRFRERLRVEATVTGRLRNPHIAHIYDYGETESDEAGSTPYLVMELVDGQPLATVLADGARLDWKVAVGIAAEVAATLAAAHADGLVHCDVKPDNVLLTADGVKLIDFGISAAEGCAGIEEDGQVLGTVAYLAPERLVGAPVGPAADVYALGIMLYRMIAGVLPWAVEDQDDLLHAHLRLDPDPPRLPEGAPRELAELCVECLHKDPSRRSTATQLAGVLPRMAAHARDVPQETTTPLGALSAAVRRPAGRAIAALAAVAVCLTVAMFVWRGGSGPTRAVAAAPTTVSCVATFAVDRDWGSGFAATLTVVNTGATLRGWTIVFHFSGGQLLSTGASATIPEVGLARHTATLRQTGVTVTASNPGQTLAASDSITLPVAGLYTGTNQLPLDFRLNDRPCVARIVGAAVPPTPTSGGGVAVAGPGGTAGRGASGGGTTTGTPLAAPSRGTPAPVAASRTTLPPVARGHATGKAAQYGSDHLASGPGSAHALRPKPAPASNSTAGRHPHPIKPNRRSSASP